MEDRNIDITNVNSDIELDDKENKNLQDNSPTEPANGNHDNPRDESMDVTSSPHIDDNRNGELRKDDAIQMDDVSSDSGNSSTSVYVNPVDNKPEAMILETLPLGNKDSEVQLSNGTSKWDEQSSDDDDGLVGGQNNDNPISNIFKYNIY